MKCLPGHSSLLLLSGRTHQLRVHCSVIGHPIVGDFTYSLGADDSPYRMMLHAHLLHIPLEPQHLLVTAGDPFVPALDPKWLPQRSLRTLAATVEDLLEQRKAKEEEQDRVRREEEKRRKSKKQKIKESEEQRRACQDWLSEWAGDWCLLPFTFQIVNDSQDFHIKSMLSMPKLSEGPPGLRIYPQMWMSVFNSLTY